MSLHWIHYPSDSETTRFVFLHQDSVSEWIRHVPVDNQCLFFLQSLVDMSLHSGYTILIPRQPVSSSSPLVLDSEDYKTSVCLQDSVSEWSDIHYPDSEDNQCLFFLQCITGRHVAPLGYTILIPESPGFVFLQSTGRHVATIGIHYPGCSETSSDCSSSSPLVDMSLHWIHYPDSEDKQCLSSSRIVYPLMEQHVYHW